ncbi:unnamed protein product [Mytilus edulis]|uniref:DZIP3-like HEPN domain-containing protein n=1 Tax=Mytilus edulis TaxID=6550 RepID=A0A8S3QJT8_MYTED|nr:unnamed protein product [Mytilus edulis]
MMAPLLEEEENYVRLALLLKGVSPRAVRTYFDREFPPTHLPSTLNTNYNTLQDLKLKRVLNQAQWNLLFPRNVYLNFSSAIFAGPCSQGEREQGPANSWGEYPSELSSNIFDVIGVPDFITFDVIDVINYNSFDVIGVPVSTTFDVTLMICLIRNLTSVTQPINGFDSLPLPVETTPGPDLARIKWYRNILAHHDSNKMATGDFNTAWSNISI